MNDFMRLKDNLIAFLIGISMMLSFHSSAQNNNYLQNRAPLRQNPFISLPLGAVKAEGWLYTQLDLQRSGLTGESERLYAGELTNDNAWLGGRRSDWERAPYYVKGLVALAYALDDQGLKNKAQKYINWILENQQADGNIGPSSNGDWWPRMIVVYYLRDYYEATKDQRVIEVLKRYFQYQQNNIGNVGLNMWGGARAGDNLEVVLWLYNVTGDGWLLNYADDLNRKAFNWTDHRSTNTFEGWMRRHIVNITQGAKLPAVAYQRTNNDNDRDAYENGYDNLMRETGRIDGMFAGSERITHRYTTSGTELCATAEEMLSAEVAIKILGDALIGDHLEKITFNALPAHLSANNKQICYYQIPNQVVSKAVNGHDGFIDEHGNNLCPSPYSGFPCCRFNWHMAWPMFVKHMWMATNDNGIAVMAYGPSTVNAKVANNVDVTIKEETNYPFEENIKLTVDIASSTSFPIKLRIPGWCKNPIIKVNGVAIENVRTGVFHTINRTWNKNDVIDIEFPAEITTSSWARNSVGIERGPLVYALEIDEDWRVRSTHGNGFDEFEVFPTSSWNYGLEIDRSNPEKTLTFQKRSMTNQPFGQSPLAIIAQGRKVPQWGLKQNGVNATEPPISPVVSNEPLETITLIPYGNNQLRVSNFPVIGDSKNTYEAEDAQVSRGNIENGDYGVSNGKIVAQLDFDDSYVRFNNVTVPEKGVYIMTIGYANGMRQMSDHNLSINGKEIQKIDYPPTASWGKIQIVKYNVALEQGANTITLTKGSSPAQLDYISIEKPSVATYEAEDAQLSNVRVHDSKITSSNQYVGEIDFDNSEVLFDNVFVGIAGEYQLRIGYANGMSVEGNHQVSVNGGAEFDVNYPVTPGWGQMRVVTVMVTLRSGMNTIRFKKGNSPAELDYIDILHAPITLSTNNSRDLLSMFTIYPNPTQGKVRLSWDKQIGTDVILLITDLHGKNLMNATVNGTTYTLETATLLEGMYVVTIQSEKKVVSKKLIIKY